MLLACCCSKSRKDGDTTIEGPESKIKNINRILLEFVNEESKIGLKEVPCINMIEKVLVASNKGEVPKRDIIQIYKSTDVVNQNSIKNFLIQDFFFVDNTRQKYDFNKIVLFNLMYSGGKEQEKANFLFNIIENAQSSAVHNHSQKLINTLENITYISTIAVGEILNSVRRFTSDADDCDFQELLSLFSTNANMLREFSNHISTMYLFPTTDDRQYLQRKEFIQRMEDCKYLLIKPNEVRKKYTEYVWQNKARALLPSKLMRRTTYGQRDYEENKNNQSDFTDSENQRSQRGTFSRNQTQSKKFQQRQMNESQVINQMRQEQQHRQDKIDRFMPAQPSPFNQSNNEAALHRSGSDISLAIYRYEDKSARDSNNSPQNKFRGAGGYQNNNQNYNSKQHPNSKGNSKQNSQQFNNLSAQQQQPQFNGNQNLQNSQSKPNGGSGSKNQSSLNVKQWETTDRGGNSPMISPATAKLGNSFDMDKDLQNKMAQLNLKRASNRESSDTQASLLSTKNLQKYQNVQTYLKEMFGEQFVNFVADMQEPFDARRQQSLQIKLQNLKNQAKLEFPEYNSYPYHIREVFEYFNAIVHKEDLLEFAKGRLFRENIVNVYMKILEKINLIRQSQYNFQRATMRNSIDLYSQNTNQTPLKILYFNTNFCRKLSNEQSLKDCLNQLQNFFKYDQVVLPFFIDEEDDQRALIVSIKVANFQVDLYDREREHDNHDISDTVLHMMDLSSRLQEVEFNEDQIDGGVEGICVERDEDMIVAMCYIAECITFNKTVDLETFNVNIERQRIVDVFLSLLTFE